MKSETKILVLATTFPRWKNDTEPPFVFELSRRLKNKIIVLAPGTGGARKKEKFGGLNIRRFSYFWPASLQKLCYDGGIRENMKKSLLAKLQLPLLLLFERNAAFNIIKKNKISIIHAHWILPQGLIAYFCKKKFNIDYVLTAHAGDVFPLKNSLLKKLAVIAIKNAKVVTANSSATAVAIKAIYPRANIEVIPMGVDISKFKKGRKKSNIIFAVGRLAEKKGFIYLIRAMAIVQKKHPELTLVIAGKGPYRKKLEKAAKELKINVKFLGPVPNKTLPNLYSESLVFAMPSIIDRSGDTEGLGVTAIEAMASGTAVVASNVGGLKNFILSGKNGILVSQKNPELLAEAIIKIHNNTALRKKLEKNGRETALTLFDWDKISKKFDILLAQP